MYPLGGPGNVPPRTPGCTLIHQEPYMSDLATTAGAAPQGGSLLDKKMKKSPAWLSVVVILIALVGGLGYVGFHIVGDLGHVTLGSTWPYLLLGTALFIALAF